MADRGSEAAAQLPLADPSSRARGPSRRDQRVGLKPGGASSGASSASSPESPHGQRHRGAIFSPVANLAVGETFNEPELAAGLDGRGFATCTPNLSGAIRIMPLDPSSSHRRLRQRPAPGGRRRIIDTDNVGSLTAAPHVRTPGEAEGFWELYLATRNNSDRGSDIPDGHLATLMRQYGVRTIYTRDRDFRRFDGIVAEDPFGS